jgi:glutamate racemase
MDQPAPVGLFDSGVGGLSVLRAVRKRLPGEDVVYLADQEFGPYGDRTLDDVRVRCERISRFLIGEGAKSIVVACNSASAAALHHLRRLHPTRPFIGMEPAVKPAALATESGIVAVMATEATFQGELFASVVDRHANGTEVIAQACPGLAAAIEAEAEDLDVLLVGYLRPLLDAGADAVVLGCTHYALVADRIRGLVGESVAVIDPAPAVVRQLRRVLARDDELASGGRDGVVEFRTTGDPRRFRGQLSRLLGIDARPVQAEV